ADCDRRTAAGSGGTAARLRLRSAMPERIRSLPSRATASSRRQRPSHGALLASFRPRRRKRGGPGGTSMIVLQATDLSKHFPARRGILGERGVVRAVDGISFTVEGGRTLGVVGESGCGKTTTAKLVLGLEEPTGGSIRFEKRDLKELDSAARRHYRRSVQAVFQDPYASLNPRMRVSAIIAEPLVTNRNLNENELRRRVSELL